MAIGNTMKPKTLKLVVVFFPFPHSFGHGWAMGDNRPKLRLLPIIEKSENQTQTPACLRCVTFFGHCATLWKWVLQWWHNTTNRIIVKFLHSKKIQVMGTK